MLAWTPYQSDNDEMTMAFTITAPSHTNGMLTTQTPFLRSG
jgi:hypothetical protein